MIPLLTAGGYRVIVPDLIGFGRSDKPTSRSDYTYAAHVGWLSCFVLDLTDITLVCQDWGGLLGLRVVAAYPERFARVVTANAGLPDARDMPAEMAGPIQFSRAGNSILPELTAGQRPQCWQLEAAQGCNKPI